MKKDLRIIILFFAFMFCFTQLLLANSVLTGDDTCFSFLYGGIKFIKTQYYGSWLMYVMNTLFYVIPDKMNFNLQDWCMAIGSLFKASVITVAFVYIYKILKRNIDSVQKSLIAAIVFYMLFFILHSSLNFIDFIINEGFFRFIVPAFLMEVFLYYFYCFTKGDKINLNAFLIYSLFVAASSEISAIILISTVLIWSLINQKAELKNALLEMKNFIAEQLSSKLDPKKLEEEKQITDKDFNPYFQILIMLVLGFICLITSKGFGMHINDKIAHLSLNLQNFNEFALTFLKNIIWNYILIYIAIFFFMFKNKEKSFFPIYIIAGTFFFYFLLFFIGKTSYDSTFWITHNDLFSFLIMSLITALAFTIKEINIKKSFAIIIFLLVPFVNSSILLVNTLSNIKDFTYARDKIRMFYDYKNLPAVMPEFAKYYMFLSVINKNKINIQDNHFIKDFSNPEQENEINMLMNRDYYPIIYKAQQNTPWEIKENALQLFFEMGGNLDELKTKKYNFSNLTDKDFVLNCPNKNSR